jgi:hypothetical protein
MLNEKYSYKDFNNQDFSNLDPAELNNSEIVGSCFHQNNPASRIFPENMTGVTFQGCNLDNTIVPPGNTVENTCCHKSFGVENDGEYWLLDASLKPVSPLKPDRYDKLNLSKDPKDLPLNRLDEPITRKKTKELRLERENLIKVAISNWENENPDIKLGVG